MQNESLPYQTLCTQYYELDKPMAPQDAFNCYLAYAKEAAGAVLEPMCGMGRFLIPLMQNGIEVTGFDCSAHMLGVCKRKCRELDLTSELFEANFETFVPKNKFDLIFIPDGSFCLLTDKEQVSQALKSIWNWLTPKGKFVFEVETLRAVDLQQGVWKSRWVSKPDGSKIVLNTVSRFDEASQIETVLCRYELWERNATSQVEVEDFRLKLYAFQEIDHLLHQHGFKVVGKWEPYKKGPAGTDAPTLLFECIKYS